MEISIKWNMCRVCLKESGAKQMHEIHKDSKLAEQIYECSGVVVNSEDTLPDKMCRKCLNMLKYAVHFRKLCRSSDHYLQTVIRKAKSATALLKRENPLTDEELDLDLNESFCEDEDNDRADIGDEEPKADSETELPTSTKTSLTNDPAQEDDGSKDDGDDDDDYSDEREDKSHQREMMEFFDTADASTVHSGSILQNYGSKGDPRLETVYADEVDGYIEEEPEEDGLEPEIDDEHPEQNEFMYKSETDQFGSGAETKYSGEIVDGESIVYILREDEIKQEGQDQYGVGADIAESEESDLGPQSIVDVIQMDEGGRYHMEEEEDDAHQAYVDNDDMEFRYDDPGTSGVVMRVKGKSTAGRVSAEGTVKGDNLTKPILSSTWKQVGKISLLVCDICGNQFTNRSLMNHHLRMHRNEKSYECELCYKRFNAACNLRAHMRVHTGEKPYECQYCLRKFADRSTHIKHERIHTNERPFTCTICGKSFALSTTLRAHEKVHTGEKPYRCEPCGKAFKLPHQLKAHLNTHLHKVIALDEQNQSGSKYQ